MNHARHVSCDAKLYRSTPQFSGSKSPCLRCSASVDWVAARACRRMLVASSDMVDSVSEVHPAALLRLSLALAAPAGRGGKKQDVQKQTPGFERSFVFLFAESSGSRRSTRTSVFVSLGGGLPRLLATLYSPLPSPPRGTKLGMQGRCASAAEPIFFRFRFFKFPPKIVFPVQERRERKRYFPRLDPCVSTHDMAIW